MEAAIGTAGDGKDKAVSREIRRVDNKIGSGLEGAGSGRTVQGDRLASQARDQEARRLRSTSAGSIAGHATPARADLRGDHQGCAGGAVGSVRSDLWQAAQGDDPDAAAGAGAARPARARQD